MLIAAVVAYVCAAMRAYCTSGASRCHSGVFVYQVQGTPSYSLRAVNVFAEVLLVQVAFEGRVGRDVKLFDPGMGKLTHFKISLLEDKEIYHAGEEVIGKLEVTLSHPMLMKSLKILFAGKAHVDWSEGSGDSKSSYWASQIIFYEEKVVVGGWYSSGHPTPDESFELGCGSHMFPFRFTLPAQLPSTFEDTGGYIRYYIKASIEKPWKFNHNVKKVFTVLDSLDLNILSNALALSGACESKRLCCWCCKSGPIELEFYVDRTGYVPGEWITINATVDNKSKRQISKTAVILYRKATYYAEGHHHTAWKSIVKMDCQGCEPSAVLKLENKRLQIPPLPPTEQVHCRILDIEYLVEVVVHTPAFSIDLKGQAPIIIGTIPLRNLPHHVGNNDSVPSGSEIACTPPPSFSTLPPAPPPNFSMLSMQSDSVPPPSYAAAIGGSVNARDNEDNEFTMGEMEYTPHYLYYDWNQPGTKGTPM